LKKFTKPLATPFPVFIPCTDRKSVFLLSSDMAPPSQLESLLRDGYHRLITMEQMESRMPGQLFYEKIGNYDFIIFLLAVLESSHVYCFYKL